ncbi:transglycosylase SLT domain-containing protein [Thermomonas sp.]|uniref:transglycosylase SLT domain-containing protein n=1 Tax=Thermomonas sp. TaxID=1971895 RepID=UPI0024889574|nr:transglycosylase SLT domain-containing protein [Thermomonas sp.]MDI1253814.1 transglycosylase SLT domain-containing protein [Thermomonas sp.]
MRGRRCLCLLLLVFAGTTLAASAPPTRNGGELMREFEQGLTEPGCTDASPRWRRHYAQSAKDMAVEDEVALTLFAYVLDEVRNAGLPSELALIPFVETRFHPNVRSASGPAGLWQFTTSTARRNGVGVQAGRDGRMSVVSSTRAAVKHLGRLQRRFGHQWRQTAMAYNAGEGALKASRRRHARRLSGITRSYPVKLHAIACLFIEQGNDDRWQQAIERPLPRLAPRTLPIGTRDLRRWARAQGFDPDLVAALNPGWHSGSRDILAPVAGHAAAGPRGHRKAN